MRALFLKKLLLLLSLSLESYAASNMVIFWGQNSKRQQGSQFALKEYCSCQDVDTIVLSFAYYFSGPQKVPVLNLANACETKFPNSEQLNCPNVAADIKYCQSLGKTVLLGIGGAAGDYALSSESDALNAATQVWNGFMGGVDVSCLRPFGDAVLDGVNLDLETPSQPGTYWPSFINNFKQLATSNGAQQKQYLMTASPQCPFPDLILQPSMEQSYFDMSFNFDTWANWAQTKSKNPNIKLYIGVPADSAAAPAGGYTDINGLTTATRNAVKSPNFGGFAVWDASRSTPEFLQGLRSISSSSSTRRRLLREKKLKRRKIPRNIGRPHHIHLVS